MYVCTYVSIYVCVYSCKTLWCKKVQPYKVESYLEVNV